METIFSTENLYTILSGRTHSAFNRALLTNFRKNNISLTKEQWTILGVLWKNEGCTQHLGIRWVRSTNNEARVERNRLHAVNTYGVIVKLFE